MFSEGNGYVRWPCMHEDEREKETHKEVNGKNG